MFYHPLDYLLSSHSTLAPPVPTRPPRFSGRFKLTSNHDFPRQRREFPDSRDLGIVFLNARGLDIDHRDGMEEMMKLLAHKRITIFFSLLHLLSSRKEKARNYARTNVRLKKTNSTLGSPDGKMCKLHAYHDHLNIFLGETNWVDCLS